MLRITRRVSSNTSITKGVQKENIGPLLNGAVTVATEAAEKVEMLNIFFASVFTAKSMPQELVTHKTRDKAWR